MKNTIAIRYDNRYQFERRIPLVPDDILELMQTGIQIELDEQLKNNTYFDFNNEQIKFSSEIFKNDIIIGVKEPSIDQIFPNKTYLAFAHIAKGQQHNVDLLHKFISTKSTLIDYEKIINADNNRILTFGRYAGISGIVNTFWVLGKLFNNKNIETPFALFKPTHTYDSIKTIIHETQKLKERIEREGTNTHPIIIGITGKGNVAKGILEIAKLLPHEELTHDQLLNKNYIASLSNKKIYFVYYSKEDLYPIFSGKTKHSDSLEKTLPLLTVLMHAVYWSPHYPKPVTAKLLHHIWQSPSNQLLFINDISCDLAGGIEITNQITEFNNPIYYYNPTTQTYSDTNTHNDLCLMSIGNLPSQLPVEASTDFSNKLKEFIPILANTNFKVNFHDLALPDTLKNAIIIHHGKLTPRYTYLKH